MYQLLVILFIIKLYAQNNIFNIIKGKYGQTTVKTARLIERLHTKVAHIKTEIKFISMQEKYNYSNIRKTQIINRSFGKTMEAEISNKHKERKDLTKN